MGLTIACVYNDLGVRRHCLDRSLAAHDGSTQVQYLPVDNTAHAFPSAGAALNHAVRQADHDVVVFAHQDVFLHDVDRLATAASALEDPRWGVIGACGVTSRREWAGRLRDRVILVGTPADTPVAVDTLDEVLFMARRDTLLDEPLSEDPDLAWHAYAVEYALRTRAIGRLAGAVDTAITHNSLTINLARLDEAHRYVARRYRELLPIRTTCGNVTGSGWNWRDLPVVRSHRWRRSWLLQSRRAARVRSTLGVPVVIADIAHEVDLLDFSAASPLHLINVDHSGAFARLAGARVTLERRGRPVRMSSVVDHEELKGALGTLSSGDRVLVTGLGMDDLPRLRATVRSGDWLAGVQWNEAWLLGGPCAARPPKAWHRPQAVPLGAGQPAGSG